MSAELPEKLRPTLANWERGNFAAGGDVLARDVHVEWFTADGLVVSEGWEEVGAHLREVFEQWARYRIELGELTAIDDEHVLMEGRQHGLGKRSGVEVSNELYVVFRFGGDRVTAMFWHPDRAEALRVAGLGESGP